jgi:hypothetical protein
MGILVGTDQQFQGELFEQVVVGRFEFIIGQAGRERIR